MFACIDSFINILLFVSECPVHVLLFVGWAHVVLCSARQRLLWKKTRKDRGCAVLHVAAVCSFNVLSMNVCVCVCVCDCFMSSRNWTAHQVLACIASDVVSALYVCIVVFCCSAHIAVRHQET